MFCLFLFYYSIFDDQTTGYTTLRQNQVQGMSDRHFTAKPESHVTSCPCVYNDRNVRILCQGIVGLKKQTG